MKSYIGRSDSNKAATYLPRDPVLMANEVRIRLQTERGWKFCDVEIFQTTISKRPIVMLLQIKNELSGD